LHKELNVILMNLKERIQAFATLGNRLANLSQDQHEQLCQHAHAHNNWFTPQNVQFALSEWASLLTEEKLTEWTKKHTFGQAKRIGVVMAGNIPLVGFHDLLCVLISGHSLRAKLSSKDTILMKTMIAWLKEIADFDIEIVEQLKNIDAVIATGSDNSARYFEYYFGKYPNIIRQHRNSCAVVRGDETAEDFLELANDIFVYFGLGCRNISKIYVPQGCKVEQIFDAFARNFADVLSNHKYNNNYEYSCAIYLINHITYLDNGYLILTENTDLVAPTGVVYYEYYQSEQDLAAKLLVNEDKIQCVISKNAYYPKSIAFGTSQKPALDDYADNVDSLAFLASL